ncbi:MAG: calcium-binding protein [Devosia sp.]
MMTTVSPVSAEILVNSATASDQEDARITSLVGGGFVLTWRDAAGDGSYSAVKAQLFADDGSKIGSEILVNTLTPGYQDEAEIAALSGGGFVIVWEGASGDYIAAQAFSATGLRIGGEVTVTVAATQTYRPEITALADNRFAVAWIAIEDSRDIQARVFAVGADDVTAVSGVIGVNTATAGFQDLPEETGGRITALSSGFVVTWQDLSLGVGGAGGDTTSTAVKAQVFTADGIASGSEILVNTATAGPQDEPMVAGLAGGGFAIVWRDQSNGVGGATGDTDTAVKAQAFLANGAKVGGEILVNTTTAMSQDEARITALSNGGFVVTWESKYLVDATFHSLYDIKAQIFTASGGPVGGEISVNTSRPGGSPEITALADGGFAIAWEDFSTGGAELKVQAFASDGVKIGSELPVNTATMGYQSFPQIMGLENGDFVISWQDDSHVGGDSSGEAVKARVFGVGEGGTPQPPLFTTITGTKKSEKIDASHSPTGQAKPTGGDDWIKALAGDDTVKSLGGDDTLSGGKGKDALNGGKGKDAFVFDTKLVASNVDTITGFKVKDDTIWLDKDIFTKLGAIGDTIGDKGFWASKSGIAHDKNDRLIYETDTGKLVYDDNGNKDGHAVLIALLDKGLHLTEADFLIV